MQTQFVLLGAYGRPLFDTVKGPERYTEARVTRVDGDRVRLTRYGRTGLPVEHYWRDPEEMHLWHNTSGTPVRWRRKR